MLLLTSIIISFQYKERETSTIRAKMVSIVLMNVLCSVCVCANVISVLELCSCCSCRLRYIPVPGTEIASARDLRSMYPTIQAKHGTSL